MASTIYPFQHITNANNHMPLYVHDTRLPQSSKCVCVENLPSPLASQQGARRHKKQSSTHGHVLQDHGREGRRAQRGFFSISFRKQAYLAQDPRSTQDCQENVSFVIAQEQKFRNMTYRRMFGLHDNASSRGCYRVTQTQKRCSAVPGAKSKRGQPLAKSSSYRHRHRYNQSFNRNRHVCKRLPYIW